MQGLQNLNSYEITFHVRQANWYTEPNGDFGFNPYTNIVDSGAGYSANFSAAGKTVFSYANTQNSLSFTRASIYLATPMTPPSGSVTPLLTDNDGNALSLIYQMGDGREYLTQTFDSNPVLTHNLVVAYGLVRWVTKGLFLGEYHVYSVPQVDDIFMQNDDWQSNTPCPNGGALPQFRLSGTDWDQVVAWQNAKQQNPALSNFILQMSFVGSFATGDPSTGGFVPDTLTPEVKLYRNKFNWISHTWDHQHLDTATAALTDTELLQNNAEALALGLPGYSPALLVTPAIAGLNNSTFINQAVQDGIRYLVSDTSVLGQPNNGPNPSPNVGIVSTINPLLYEVPRHATNLFYNVSTPDGWASEYHCIFAGQAPYDTFTYEQIRDNVSATLLINMLTGDMDPQMFHESNLRAYDGTHSLFTDVYDETLNTYTSLLTLPVLSPTQDVIGQNMKSRDLYDRSGVTAWLTGGATPTITIAVPANSAVSAATIPVTGLAGVGAEVYAGQKISHIAVTKGQTITVPVP